jgi:phage repressor protein C with HTH and peptisase S24 domain
MRLYAGSSQQFITDTIQNQIADKLKNAFFAYYRFNPSPGEMASWRNSLRAMSQVFQYAKLTDHGVVLEYQLPLTSRRLDCLVTGRDGNGSDNAVIVELKQWESCEEAEGENEVLTWLGGSRREVLHPSAQVGQYAMYLQDGHTAFYEDSPVMLNACTYLHNYSFSDGDVLLDDKFREVVNKFPLFSSDDVDPLKDYLEEKLEIGQGLDVLGRVERGKYRPSKKLMDHVGQVIRGTSQYVLLDEQLVVYDKVFACARKGFHDKQKTAIVIRGGPGTGKSIIAINLMADLLLQGYNAHYATGSRAFTQTLRKVIGPRGAIQFKYFNSYTDADQNAIDVLISDEAHRIRKTSSHRFTPKAERSDVPQVQEIINAGKVSVFFIDDDQVVRPDEIGSVEYIRSNAEIAGCTVHEYELEVQFRCSGSEAFVNWVNNTLGIRRTANVLWNGLEEFDFRIFDSPESLEQEIRQKEHEGFTARMTAGFCWKWSKKPCSDGQLKDDVVIGDYRRPWNARPEAPRLARGIPKATLWAYDPNGIDQIGCVYTAQGFEFDYVGVIFGNDLVYDFDGQRWNGIKENSHDSAVRRAGDRAAELIKNTYRVLLSRGMKGCYVCFLDKDTERFIRSRTENLRPPQPREVLAAREPDIQPYENALPLVNLRAAANAFYDSLDGFFADESNYEWVYIEGGPYPKDRFLVRIEGDSMEPRIPDESLCLFRKDPGGSRNGKIVLCSIGSVGGAPLAVVKRYQSIRLPSQDSIGEAVKITLSSLNTRYEDIELTGGEELRIIGIFEGVVSKK